MHGDAKHGGRLKMEIGGEILLEGLSGERRCSRWAVRRAAGRAAGPTWFRMFLTGEVMSEKTKRQRFSYQEKCELMKEVKADASIQFTVRM